MTEYNRQNYTDRIQTPTPGHQPIYIQVPLNWIANLDTQVAPRSLRDPGVASPLLIGTASKSGAIIESFWVTGINPTTTGGGGGGSGGGGTTPTITGWGFGTAADPLLIHIYTRRQPDEIVYFLSSINVLGSALAVIAAGAAGQFGGGRYGFPILPNPEVAWRLEPGQEVFVALSKPIPAPGLNFFMFGGHYS